MYFGIACFILFSIFYRTFFSRNEILLLLFLIAWPLINDFGFPAYLAASVGLYLSSIRNSFLDEILSKNNIENLLKLNLFIFYLFYFLSFFGIFINITELFGFTPQRTHFLQNYRPSGLLLEPNSYCVMIFLLSFILYRKDANTSNVVKALSAVSIFLSQSLWGIFLLPIILIMYFKVKGAIKFTILASPIFVALAVGIFLSLQERISGGLSGEELSFIIRLGDMATTLNRVSFFGEGFNYENWESPSIFLPWLLIKAGIIWSAAFVFLIIFRLGLYNAFIILIPLFFTQPLLSNLIFWLAISRQVTISSDTKTQY